MNRQHIFVVNGSPDLLNLIRELLQDESFNVTTTNFVPETFDQVAALDPALIILDLVLNERAGWDLLEHLHAAALTNDIPVIVLSTEPELLRRAKEQTARYGGQRFMAKPFDIDHLLAAVDELIGSA